MLVIIFRLYLHVDASFSCKSAQMTKKLNVFLILIFCSTFLFVFGILGLLFMQCTTLCILEIRKVLNKGVFWVSTSNLIAYQSIGL